MFGKKERINKNELYIEGKEKKIIIRPRICCIDMNDDVIKTLKSDGYSNVYIGTFGSLIKVPNKRHYDKCKISLNYDLPENLHEFDIFLIDLESTKEIDYNPEEFKNAKHTGKAKFTLVSKYPETIFNPRPMASGFFNDKFDAMGHKANIIIVFSSADYNIEYDIIEILNESEYETKSQDYSIYSLLNANHVSSKRIGEEMKVFDVREDLKKVLEDNLHEAYYNQTFEHPTTWKNGQYIPKESFIPLIKNSNNEIVSYFEENNNSFVFVFPQIKSKHTFLETMLSEVLPDILPEVFPFSNNNVWKDNIEYWLPNHKKLIDEKEKIKDEYENKISQKEKEINANINHYSFLHNLLTESGNDLVSSIVKYLKWLGFNNVIIVDENIDSKILEEDIQIELEDALLIIECKGVGGTSTDSDCSQISKIKHRRCKERNRFDVFALYIVNHQRHLPPLNRRNPPFTDNQINDAINDERGLLTTWQLFNLFYDIENGVISKSDARKALLDFGLVNFKPKNILFIDEPKEFFNNGKVCIINLNKLTVTKGEEIILERNGRFSKAIIEDIRVDNKPIDSIDNGEIGLKLNIPIKRKTILWKKY